MSQINIYPDINCNDTSTAIIIPSGSRQRFCVSAPSSSFASSDSNKVKINGTIKIPTNIAYTPTKIEITQRDITCNQMSLFNPFISNIEYSCSGQCPLPNTNTSKNRTDVSADCQLNTITGPNVILVHKYKTISNHNVVDNTIRNQSDYNNILAFTEGNENICPSNAWNVSTGNNSIDAKCYCPWDKIKKYTNSNKTQIRCA